MSICVCIQNERELMIGADTAVTQEINGVRYRLREPYKKVRQIGDFVIFGSGMSDVMNEVYSRFELNKEKTVEKLQKIVKQSCKDFKEAYPHIYESKSEITRDVAVLAATMERGKAVVYVMTPQDNFKIEKLITPPGRSIPHVGGFYADEASEYVGQLIRNGVHADKAIIQTIRHFSGETVGGDITLVKLDENGIQIAPSIPTVETVRIPYYVGGYLYGSMFRTNREGYPYCEISSTDNIFKAAKSDTSYIEIEANPESHAGPIIKHVDGDTVAFTGAMGGDYFTLVSGGDYDIGAQDGEVRVRGNNVSINAGGSNYVIVNRLRPSVIDLYTSNVNGLLQSDISGLVARLTAIENRLDNGGL